MQDRLRVPLELKTISEREFEGYGAVFKNVDLGGDVIMPGAFRKSLANQDRLPPMFWMHRPDQIPGKWLSMSEDRHGLRVKGTLADTALGRETHTLLKMEAVTGLSIGYQPMPNSVEFTDDGVRILKELHLFETSIVSIPMNPLATVSAVKTRTSALGEYVPTARELEHEFRRMGCSKNISRRLVSMIVEEDDAGGTLADSEDKSGIPAEPTGETPEPNRCDAEEEAAAKAMQEIVDQLLADQILRRVRGKKS